LRTTVVNARLVAAGALNPAHFDALGFLLHVHLEFFLSGHLALPRRRSPTPPASQYDALDQTPRSAVWDRTYQP